MTEAAENTRAELARVSRVADLLATCHSILRDKYAGWANTVQVIVLIGSVWLSAMAFADPIIEKVLTPADVPPKIWIGLIGALVFTLTLIDMLMAWRKKSELHGAAAAEYSGVKISIRRHLEQAAHDVAAEKALLERYEQIGRHSVKIPDRLFLTLKRQHKIKIEVSNMLDSKPGASVHLARLAIWLRDNFGLFKGAKK